MTRRRRSSRGGGTRAAPGTAALWTLLALLVAARAVLARAPGMWAWSLNLQRFLPPVPGWSLWALAALPLLPAISRRIAPWLAWAGDAFADHPALAAASWAALAAALVWVLPDRVRFVGDFLLRQGTVQVSDSLGGVRTAILYPQALPLDVYLHYTLPALLTNRGLAGANLFARLLGAGEAALLGLLAAAFVRALSLRGIAAFACASAVVFGGYLGMFTGYSKAFSELCLLMVAEAVFALDMVRRDRGLLPLGIVVAIGTVLHRSALGLVPAAVLAWALWLRAHGAGGSWKRPRVLIALAVPSVTLAVMVPRVVALVRGFDVIHFNPPEVQRQGGALAAALAGNRPLDFVNLLVMLSPLALSAPILAYGALRSGSAAPGGPREPGGTGGPRTDLLLLVALGVPFLAIMPFLHPGQGPFRDWDVYAATGMAVSLLTAWLAGRALERVGRDAWLGVAMTLGVMAPTLQWLVLHTDADRGLERARAFLVEPPTRTEAERGETWDFLGVRNVLEANQLLRRGAPGDAEVAARYYADADEALGHAAETSPSPRILTEWALVRVMRGDHEGAREVYRRMVERQPTSVPGWTGILYMSAKLGDRDETRRAAGELLRLKPGDPTALRALRGTAAGAPGSPPHPRLASDPGAP